MKIAVFTDVSGLTSSPENADHLTVYDIHQSTVSPIGQLPITLDNKSLIVLRQTIKSLINTLDDCRIIVGTTITGIPYNLLDREGFHIWEFTGPPTDYLPIIQIKESALSPDDKASEGYLKYYRRHDVGIYSVDARAALFQDGNLSSKALLLPFLDHQPFTELHATFSHIPLWLNEGLKKRHMAWDSVLQGNDTHLVVIRPMSNG